jgi:ribonucleoside-diphosphate reductase alpha chain
VTIERPIEFFMPAGQRSEGQQWITSTMRLLSMVARSGGPIAKALADMRNVVWDKGTVRYGSLVRQDGTEVPRFHDSEVAALSYAMQRILIKRGFLDEEGSQVPVVALAARLARREGGEAAVALASPAEAAPAAKLAAGIGTGKPCPECGAHALHKVDGCAKCANCGYVGDVASDPSRMAAACGSIGNSNPV